MTQLINYSYIDSTVVIEEGAIVEPFAVIKGNSVIRSGAVVESHSYIVNSVIGHNTQVKSSRITDSVVGDNCTVGPFAHIRDKCDVGNNCRVGDFVELKNSSLGEHTKASHLAYIGDATVGKRCNVGCGVIFVNYDGKKKHHTTVGDDCFIGCNSNLIAPLSVGNQCYIACNCTLEGNIPDKAFVIGRSKAVIKPDYATKYIEQ